MNILVKLDRVEADRAYLREALAQRSYSDDPKARLVEQSGVGAVIVGKTGIIARSANVLPPGLKSHQAASGQAISEVERYHFIEHAERAAIFEALKAGQTLAGATLYCTRFPCSDCARAILWAGIARVVLATGLAGEARWLESQRAALRILRQGGVTVRVLRTEPYAEAAATPYLRERPL